MANLILSRPRFLSLSSLAPARGAEPQPSRPTSGAATAASFRRQKPAAAPPKAESSKAWFPLPSLRRQEVFLKRWLSEEAQRERPAPLISRVLLLQGPAGVGKSALIAHVIRSLGFQAVTLCSETPIGELVAQIQRCAPRNLRNEKQILILDEVADLFLDQSELRAALCKVPVVMLMCSVRLIPGVGSDRLLRLSPAAFPETLQFLQHSLATAPPRQLTLAARNCGGDLRQAQMLALETLACRDLSFTPFLACQAWMRGQRVASAHPYAVRLLQTNYLLLPNLSCEQAAGLASVLAAPEPLQSELDEERCDSLLFVRHCCALASRAPYHGSLQMPASPPLPFRTDASCPRLQLLQEADWACKRKASIQKAS